MAGSPFLPATAPRIPATAFGFSLKWAGLNASSFSNNSAILPNDLPIFLLRESLDFPLDLFLLPEGDPFLGGEPSCSKSSRRTTSDISITSCSILCFRIYLIASFFLPSRTSL